VRKLGSDRLAATCSAAPGGCPCPISEQNNRYSAAYYLGGYAVECGLKACIARQIRAYEYPPRRNFSNDLFSHKFKELVPIAQLNTALTTERRTNPQFAANWSEVEKWSEESRHENWTMQDAQQLIAAVGDIPNGVLEWIRQHW